MVESDELNSQKEVTGTALRVRNFRQVHPWLYRGGQPDMSGWVWLRDLGVKTVICLRYNKKVIQEEAALVESCGMSFVSIPLNYWQLPDKEIVDRFFSLLADTGNHPVFVHCLHGCDRTGMLLAMFRIKVEGWSVEAAYEEMKNCGFHWFWMHHFKSAIYNFAKQQQENS